MVGGVQPLEEFEVALQRDPRLGVEHVDGAHALGLVPLADLEIVEVMRRRDLDCAGALFRIGIFVCHDRDEAPHQRQARLGADARDIARVLGMHGDRRVAQHGLRARGGDGQHLAGLGAGRVHQGIIEVVEMAVRVLRQRLAQRRGLQRRAVVARPFQRALAFDLQHFQIGNRGLELRVPVHEPLGLVDQPLAVQAHEHLGHRLRQTLVEGEALAAPVAAGAQPLELADDGAARLGFPFPDALEERLAPHGAAVRQLALGELALDHHLRGDAGVIRAGLPEHVLALHAPVAAQDVLQRVVERMAHVQVAGDVRRRNDDAEGIGPRPLRRPAPERARVLPERGDPALDGGGFEGLVHHVQRPEVGPAAARGARRECRENGRSRKPRPRRARRGGGAAVRRLMPAHAHKSTLAGAGVADLGPLRRRDRNAATS